ncbi:GGDEF domain-containing protein [Rhodococcoides fascians]|uniref:GGDEF domain-containing protein n=1 Tax=Rhodococcoides fascians TaxID=1828 RepID=UPI00068B5275|nr:GGDEF domain-containing protein [Rhodococcus fascians]
MSELSKTWSGIGGYEGVVRGYFPRSALRFTRVALGTWCVVLAVISGLALATSAGPENGFSRALMLVIGVIAAAAGLRWIVGSWPRNEVSVSFIVYADFSVAFVFFSMTEPAVLFPGATLLAVIGSYIPIFHGWKIFVGHQVFSTSVTAILFYYVLMAPYTTAPVTLMYLLSSLLLQVTVPVLTLGLFIMLCRETSSAHFDPLTGLRNRRGLAAELDFTYSGTLFGSTTKFVVLVLDVDKFKTVNDRFGHEHGDRVLERIARHIDGAFGADAVSCRSGGEEFVVVLTDSEHSAAGKLRTMSAAILRDEGVSVSAGMATHACTPACAHDSDLSSIYTDLHRSADAAMYRAKRLGGNTMVVHTGKED